MAQYREYITKFISKVNPKSLSTISRRTANLRAVPPNFRGDSNVLAIEIQTNQILDLVLSRFVKKEGNADDRAPYS
jgi:hypothetical protein